MKTKKVLKFTTGVLALLMLFAMTQTEAFAQATLTVTADKASAVIGETVNVTIQASEPEDPSVPPEVSVTYNSDILEYAGANVEIGGGGGLITFSGLSATLTFTALQTGNVNIAAEALLDETTVLGNAMVTVGANGGAGLSSDATLYVLQMDPGQLVPEFSSDVTEYQIVIGNDVTDITVSGAVSDPTAQITAASGFKNLKEGTNQAVITVTAADGSMLSYHFTIVRGEATATEESDETSEEPEQQTEMQSQEQTGTGLDVTLEGNAYIVQSVIPEEIVPEGCVKTTSAFNGKPVEAVCFEKGGITLLYALKEGSEEGDFFVYNEASGQMNLFVQIYNIENRFIVPIEAQDAPPSYFKEGRMEWNEFKLPAFVLTDTSVENAEAFYLLYAVSNEGERGFYLYDAVEGTYQRFLNYSGAKSAPVAVAGEGFSKTSVLVIAILSILLVGAILLIVNMIIRNKEMQEDKAFEKKTAKKQQPKPAVKKQQPKPAVKKTVLPQSENEEDVVSAAPKKPVRKAAEPTEPKKTVRKAEPTEPKKTVRKAEPAEPKKTVRKAEPAEPKKATMDPEPVSEEVESKPERPSQPVVRQRPMMHTDHVVTLQPRQVEGTVGVTGNIPVKVVPTPKSEVRRPSVPIFTLEKPSELDDDFEFEFINIDND